MNNYRIHFAGGYSITVDEKTALQPMVNDMPIGGEFNYAINFSNVLYIERIKKTGGSITRSRTPQELALEEEKQQAEKTKNLDTVLDNAKMSEVS